MAFGGTRLVVLVLQLASYGVFGFFMLDYEWWVYMLLYSPFAALRLACLTFLGDRVSVSVTRWGGSFGDMLSSRVFPSVAPYLVATVWSAVFVVVFALRPYYFYMELSGHAEASPCGQSSCTRDVAGDYGGGTKAARVYNPNGFFPRTIDHPYFDRTGATAYLFCRFDNSWPCTWAVDKATDAIRYYEPTGEDARTCEGLGSGNLTTALTGLPTTVAADYPLGRGLSGGFACETGRGSEPCPGAGTQVCAACDEYEDSVMSLLGVDGDAFFPKFADPNVMCRPKNDGVSPLCAICPGGNWGDEIVTPLSTERILWAHVGLVGEAVLCLLIVARAVYSDSGNYEYIGPVEPVRMDSAAAKQLQLKQSATEPPPGMRWDPANARFVPARVTLPSLRRRHFIV